MAMQLPLRAVLLAIGVHTLWGANPVAIKFSLEVFPPLWTAFLRFLIALVCIVVWARLQGVRLMPTRGEWPVLLAIGGLFVVQIATMNIGYDHTTGAMGSVLIATNPLFAAGFAHLLVSGDRLTVSRCVGLGIALAGTVMVLLDDADIGELDFGASGNWIVLFSATILGLRLATSARALKNIEPARVAIWQTVISLPVFAAGALAFETIRWQNMGVAPIAGLLYQAIFVAGIAFMVNFALMKRYRPSVIMSFNFVSPVAGVLLAVWLLDERSGALLLSGMALVAAGLWFIARED